MKETDYIPTTYDLYCGLIGQKVVVFTTNTPLGGILNDVSSFFVELKSEHSSGGFKFTYVLANQIVAISSDEESGLGRRK